MTAKIFIPLTNDRIVNVLGVPINALTLPEVVDYADEVISKNSSLHIGVVNASKMVNMERNPILKKDVLASDIILADGISVVWASRLLGDALPVRVTGIDLMYSLFERGNEKNFRFYCLGATEEVSLLVEEKVKAHYPNAIIAGRRNGYFSEEDEEQIAQDIAASKADVLFCAMTSPKKEIFMAKWNDVMQVKIVHGVGGSFDVMSGKVERAAELWQKLGLEWLYRVKQEPGRLWKRYLTTNALFCWMILKSLLTNTANSSNRQ